MRKDQPGISNRETSVEEQQERMEFPPVRPDAPPVEQDAAGREGEEHPEQNDGRHTSHKAGSRSIAQRRPSRNTRIAATRRHTRWRAPTAASRSRSAFAY